MPKVELAKSIEARKLNPRTGRPVDTVWLTVPFGAILENPVEKGDLVEFSYLGELYHCKYSDIKESLKLAAASVPEASGAATVVANAAMAAEPMLRWERVKANYGDVYRARVPGGWLVASKLGDAGGLAFYADTGHTWDGTSPA